jgi:hypothetical protein
MRVGGRADVVGIGGLQFGEEGRELSPEGVVLAAAEEGVHLVVEEAVDFEEVEFVDVVVLAVFFGEGEGVGEGDDLIGAAVEDEQRALYLVDVLQVHQAVVLDLRFGVDLALFERAAD